MTRLFLKILVAGFLLPAFLPAQGEGIPKEEQELNKKAARILYRFARSAERNKVGPRAKQAYDLILDHYDAEHAQARRALGYKKNKGVWELEPPEKQPQWKDDADNDQRYRVVEEWYETAVEMAELHRELGLKLMQSEDLVRGTYHLERAVYYNPADREAHLALGHEEYDGFFGTEREVAFVKRMKEIETTALELARKEYEVEAIPLDKKPEELAKLGLQFHGAKSEHFTIWTRGSQENADNCAKWAERALDFMIYLLGEDLARRLNVVNRAAKRFNWIGFVWTTQEREDFLKANPQIWQGREGGFERAKAFANVSWKSSQGPALVDMRLTPAGMHDRLAVLAFELGLATPYNDALSEGLYHAVTWYLMSTSMTKHGALPEGTVTGRELELPESTSWWLRAIRDQATAGTDWPLNQVPREQLSRFRNDVRMKSWSFMTWVLAAYPDAWHDFLKNCPDDKIPFPEEIDEIGEKAFDKPLSEVEAEWRDWARGSSGVAAATGYGPPLLPEKPNKEEIEVLERLNALRAKLDLPPCMLDAEASMACEEHARYLTMYPEEHLKWPEAHEENPANPGFSPRGMRAGLRSVIIWSTRGGVDFARDSVDGWIGTVYHRFPLLMHNIKRFGYSYVDENGYAIGVLDMGSLQEPYDPNTAPKYIPWPAHQMEDIPRRFHGIEHPNPIGDYNPDPESITETGYPVSLQLQREIAMRLAGAGITMYEVKARGKPPSTILQPEILEAKPGDEIPGNHQKWIDKWTPRRGAMVPLWEHTPMDPLLKRMEEKEVVFGIPKEHLKPRTTYQVEVHLTLADGQERWIFWEFTTGSQMEGLGRL